jgi:hypothetical protein
LFLSKLFLSIFEYLAETAIKAEEFAARAPDEVLNQLPALENYNLYECDRPLREVVVREGGRWGRRTGA